MTENIIHKSNNDSMLKLKKNNDYYYIYFLSSESNYYCINNHGIKCYCKDKDWLEGLWDGELYYSSNYEEILNIFYFLKDNFEILSTFNRKKLGAWFRENIYRFINKYYEEELLLTKIHILYLFNIGFFGEKFYTIIKDKFIIENKDLLNIKIDTEYNYDNPKNISYKKTIKIGDITLYHDVLHDYNNINKSLFEICIEHYEDRFGMYNFILNSNNFLLNNINIENSSYIDIDIDLIQECSNKIYNYFSVNKNISEIIKEFIYDGNLNLFYEKYSISEDIKDLLQKHDIKNIEYFGNKINNIIEEWNLIDHNLKY